MEKPARPNAFHDLRTRIITGVVLASITFIALWQGDIVFTVFIALCAVIMLHEWRGLTSSQPPLLTLVGIPYILLPCLSLIGLRMMYFDEAHSLSIWPTLYVIAVVAATDTGAYVSGRCVGGPRLAPSISPKKTWAGLLGGMFCGVMVSYLLSSELVVPSNLPEAIAVGMIVSVISQLGDLFESWMKRKAEMKDSGTLLPGHGGLLDRVDGLLFAAPVYFLICLMAGGRML